MVKEIKKQDNIINRPPVVVVLGHVDHGKSSILEAIKDFKITSKEAGGITQHIGAYEIEQDGKKITFIDTPGHEAFSLMRSRGTGAADIAILVVAGEEGIKPQTKEAIEHIKKSGIPAVVAINKMDKPQADALRVKQELLEKDFIVEEMGGKIPCVEVSAKTKKGIPDLLSVILLISEMEDFKGDLGKTGEGVVIEAYADSKRGPTTTLLLRDGVLNLQDIIVTDLTFGKIKILEDFQGRILKKAMPSQPIVVIGFEKVPQVGEGFSVYSDFELARKHIINHKRKIEHGDVLVIDEDKKVLNLILKTDVVGSLEAIRGVLKNLPQEKVIIRILSEGVGEINDNDVKLALSSNARIVGFRVKTDRVASGLLAREGIRVKIFDVIYELIQAVREMMEKRVEATIVRDDLGKLKILAVFKTEKNRQIVGGRIIQGGVKRGVKIEVFHDDEKIGQGKLVHLQRNKKDIEKAGKGDEVGLLYEGSGKIDKGDLLVFYIEEKKKLGL